MLLALSPLLMSLMLFWCDLSSFERTTFESAPDRRTLFSNPLGSGGDWSCGQFSVVTVNSISFTSSAPAASGEINQILTEIICLKIEYLPANSSIGLSIVS